MTEDKIVASVQRAIKEQVAPIFDDIIAKLSDVEFLKARVAYLESSGVQNEDN
jgi:hypothetical protein